MTIRHIAIALALTACAGTEHINVQPDTGEPQAATACDDACACELIESAPVMTSWLVQSWVEHDCANRDALFVQETDQIGGAL